MIQILQNVSLKLHSTMRLGGKASFVCSITNEQDILEAVAFAKSNNLPIRTIGIGSNIFWKDEGFAGLLLINKIESFEVVNDTSIIVGAGLNWDTAVKRSVDSGLSGIEYLSLIPGSSGATPVQNVGAYGCEIKDLLVSLMAYDLQKNAFVTLQNKDCLFGYRTSRFKTVDAGRFIIFSITLQLSNQNPKAPFYDSLQKYLDNLAVAEYTAQIVREAVINIRSSKLPDPALIANNGSFFSNPIIQKSHYKKLQKDYPDVKGWPLNEDKVKIAAGWLIEAAGFNDFHDTKTGMATWHLQNLVLVNEHATSTEQLLAFKQKIVSAVYDKFAITLQQEPELLP